METFLDFIYLLHLVHMYFLFVSKFDLSLYQWIAFTGIRKFCDVFFSIDHNILFKFVGTSFIPALSR